jgi:mono/diheme cytochrome c family protein
MTNDVLAGGRRRPHRRAAGIALTCGALGLVVLAGCLRSNPGPAKDSAPPVQRTYPVLSDDNLIPEVPAEFAAGREVFDRSCAKCHQTTAAAAPGPDKGMPPNPDKGFAGPDKGPPGPDKGFGGPDKGFAGGFKGMGKAPNLGKVAANPEHTREWLRGYILNPQSKREKSRMPKFEGKLSDDDLNKLVDYLLILK